MAISFSFKQPLRLHLGGWQVKEGWKILDIQKRPGVDYLGTCENLSQFVDNSVDEVYASHVYEHLGYQKRVLTALREAHRVLKPGGIIKIGVPDLEVLARAILDPKLSAEKKYHVMRMMYGGQVDDHDFHYVGYTFDILSYFLANAGFKSIRRVKESGLFNDTTTLMFEGYAISLNVEAVK
jgi:predicted SAM-dependent methyltransferase